MCVVRRIREHMLEQLQEFKDKLDEVMCKCIHSVIITYGNGRSASCLRWYAKYYHNIEVDYKISLEENPTTEHYWEPEIFQKEVFDFDFFDTRNAVIWVTVPVTSEIKNMLENNGFIENETFFDFYKIVYGEDTREYVTQNLQSDITPRKEGIRDIQMLDYLEWKYGCNFLQYVSIEEMSKYIEGAHIYAGHSHRELCAGLDLCHPSFDDAIFDYGCGKGSAMITFLDYGFSKVGGVEYQPELCDTLRDNFRRMGIGLNSGGTELIQGDAREVKEKLDRYTYFWFFDPFSIDVFKPIIQNIKDSIERNKRRVRLLYYNPRAHKEIKDAGFRLMGQIQIEERNRVLSIFENIL